jgi:y4mF family transcriptional regulator
VSHDARNSGVAGIAGSDRFVSDRFVPDHDRFTPRSIHHTAVPPHQPAMTKILSAADLGRLVRQRRKEAGFTLKDAAGMAGVGVRFLSELERGKPTLQIDRVLAVLPLFGLDLHLQVRGGPR